MWMRQVPPGRTSSWTSGLVKSFGPHHWAICSGCVQVLKTRARGALKIRVMTSSRSSVGVASAKPLIAILLPLHRCLEIGQALFEIAAHHLVHVHEHVDDLEEIGD